MERRSIIRIGKRAQCDIDTDRKTRPLDDSIKESNKHFKTYHTGKSNEESSSSISLDNTQIEEDEFEFEEEWEDTEEDQDPNSDLSIDHHPLRKADYSIYQISEKPVYDTKANQSDNI
ncbi:hypothetical protein EDC94DRAFT_666142 [Helicostylum pulchrum]|nr:hypothetical protein EDC94DRAFT_666142 [Helicostylum pulchrum]